MCRTASSGVLDFGVMFGDLPRWKVMVESDRAIGGGGASPVAFVRRTWFADAGQLASTPAQSPSSLAAVPRSFVRSFQAAATMAPSGARSLSVASLLRLSRNRRMTPRSSSDSASGELPDCHPATCSYRTIDYVTPVADPALLEAYGSPGLVRDSSNDGQTGGQVT